MFLPVDGRKYQAVSREVMTILRRFTPLVEPISIDEAFLDVTASRALFGDGETIGRAIRAAIQAEVELTASVGVATTKLVAKIASDLRKPDALVVVPPGARRRSSRRSRSSGCGASASETAAALRRARGRHDGRPGRAAERPARPPLRQARRDARRPRARASMPIRSATGEPAKSISHEHTFDVDTNDREVLIDRTLLAMADGVAGRLRSAG